MSKPPSLKYERAPCPACGALTEADAQMMCKPSTDDTGEVSCVGEFNAQGFSIQPTAASLAAIDRWIDETQV